VILSAAGPLEKPAIIKTHLRDLIITPELIGSIVAIYNGKVRTGLVRQSSR
jgi:ribosomal protein S19